MSNAQPLPATDPGTSPDTGLDTLRRQTGRGLLSGGHTRLAQGVELRADPALGLSGSWHSPAGRVLDMTASMAGRGGWIGLHVALNLGDLGLADHLVLLCRAAGSRDRVIRPCLRSGLTDERGFVDHFFDKHILTGPRPHSQADALYLDTQADLPPRAPWRELILFLPLSDFRLSLHHLHLDVR